MLMMHKECLNELSKHFKSNLFFSHSEDKKQLRCPLAPFGLPVYMTCLFMRRGVCPAVYILLMFTSAIIELGEDLHWAQTIQTTT